VVALAVIGSEAAGATAQTIRSNKTLDAQRAVSSLVGRLIHLVSVFFERPTSLEAARTPIYPGRERSSSIAVIGGNTERVGPIRNIHRNNSGGLRSSVRWGLQVELVPDAPIPLPERG
jgi:hypothetical protein